MRKKQTREGPAFFEPCGEISDDGTHERIRTSAAPSSLRALIKNEGRRFEVQNAKTVPAGWQGRLLAPCRGFEPPAYRLGVPTHVSYRVVRDALTCPQTRINQRFLKERHVTECWAISC